MCGIIAFLSNNIEVIKHTLKCLKLLQNRGYDSAGIASIKNNRFICHKVIDDLERLDECINNYEGCYSCISHTRWSTHGPKTEINAHPHIDCYNKFALVHNGIIENYKELKEMLISKGYTFKSKTDTEVIVNLISYNSTLHEDVMKCIKVSMSELRGAWALSILSLENPNKMYFAKNGSPLLIGRNDNYIIAASESLGFYHYVENYIELKDNDVICASLDSENSVLYLELTGQYDIIKIIKSKIDESPYPFPHWTIKEIMEQPLTTQKAMNMGYRIKSDSEVRLGGIEKHKELLLSLDNLLIVASGTSFHAGLIGEKFFKMLNAIDSIQCLDASEFCNYDVPLNRKTGMIVLSQSGETKDVKLAMDIARKKDIMILSVVNVVNSMIARNADCGVYVNAGREVGVASTKSFTSQVIVLSMIAIWFAQNKNLSHDMRVKMIKGLKELPLDIENSIKCFSEVKEIVEVIKDEKSCFILGRHSCEPIAKEAALKIKEISYMHAEGYPGGALKHGTFALIEPGTPIFLIAPDDEDYNKMESCAEEVKTREALTILITNKEKINEDLYKFCIRIPYNEYYSCLLSIIPFQIIAYELAIARNNDVDRPKNLAKTVSVF